MPQGPTRADEFNFDSALTTLDESFADYPAAGPPDGAQTIAPDDTDEWGFEGEDSDELSYDEDGGTHCRSDWTAEHDGFHAPSLQRAVDDDPADAHAHFCQRHAACPTSAFADGRTDARRVYRGNG